MPSTDGTSNASSPRIQRERETVEVMIELYCRGNHGAGSEGGTKSELCEECSALWEYAKKKLDLCPHGNEKPTCLKCPIHCYEQEKLERIRGVMRYAGPRMLLSHPIMAIRHILDGKRRMK